MWNTDTEVEPPTANMIKLTFSSSSFALLDLHPHYSPVAFWENKLHLETPQINMMNKHRPVYWSVTHSWCLDLEGGADEGVARGVMSSFLKSSLVSLDLTRYPLLIHMLNYIQSVMTVWLLLNTHCAAPLWSSTS